MELLDILARSSLSPSKEGSYRWGRLISTATSEREGKSDCSHRYSRSYIGLPKDGAANQNPFLRSLNEMAMTTIFLQLQRPVNSSSVWALWTLCLNWSQSTLELFIISRSLYVCRKAMLFSLNGFLNTGKPSLKRVEHTLYHASRT